METSMTPNTKDRPGVKSSSPSLSASALLSELFHKRQINKCILNNISSGLIPTYKIFQQHSRTTI